MFANTLNIVRDCGLIWLHVFPFSPRPSTPAARMPQVPGNVVKARAAKLRAAGEAERNAWLAAQVGKEKRVLVERPGLARAEDNALVRVNDVLPVGEIVTVRITGVDGEELEGA